MLTIISGVTSYGKSVMLKVMKIGGVNILDDYVRNSSNKCSHEVNENEKLEHINNSILDFEEENWAVSLVSVLLKKNPLENKCNVIFIERKIDDIINSNENIFANIIPQYRNILKQNINKSFIESHSNRIKSWLFQNPNFNTIVVDYHDLINNPVYTINEINNKLNLSFYIDNHLSVVESY